MDSEENVERARVTDPADQATPSLFPVADLGRRPLTTREVCAQIGLNWYAAGKTHEDGFLSFAPDPDATLTPGEETELRLVGTLVAAGCDAALMRRLLSGLSKPYRYRIDLLAYDWAAGAWRFVEGPMQIMNRFDDWLDELVSSADRARLDSIQRRVDDAVRRLRIESARMSPW